MTTHPPLPDALWSRIPEDVREALNVVHQFYHTRIEHLEARIAELEARLNSDSSNSHKPPSSDPHHAKPAPPKKDARRKAGGQPGHPKAERVRLTPDRVVDHKPCHCGACHAPLTGHDESPHFHQVWELPEIKPLVTEHRFHRLTCSCGHATVATAPTDVPSDGYGPRLKAVAVYLTGVAHLSKTHAERVLEDILGTPISVGQLCALEAEAVQLLAPVMDELRAALPKENVHMDETSWKQSGKLCWLWVAVAKTFTVFHIAFSHGGKVVEELLTGEYPYVLTTDRWGGYNRVEKRQLCWAHLRRDFQALIDRGGEGKAVGEQLLLLSDLVFATWHRSRDGSLPREKVGGRILEWYRPEFWLALETGSRCGYARAEGLCKDLLKRWEQMWRFCEVEGVEPTNNAAERALRPAVMWRKKSQGTRGEAGSKYVASMLSVSATCKQQQRKVWAYLTDMFAASAKGLHATSLLPAS